MGRYQPWTEDGFPQALSFVFVDDGGNFRLGCAILIASDIFVILLDAAFSRRRVAVFPGVGRFQFRLGGLLRSIGLGRSLGRIHVVCLVVFDLLLILLTRIKGWLYVSHVGPPG